FTATVSPAGPPTPTGTVVFTSNGAAISGCTAVSLSSAQIATCSTAALAVGTDAIVATYSGDSNYLGSTSNTVSQVVNKAVTATALSSSLNPSNTGQAVTFTATVNGGLSPTGTVSFTANGTSISGCSAIALSSSSNQALCTKSTLPVGSDVIVATYSGDSNNAGSSGSLTQIVNSSTSTATTTTVTSSQNPSTAGQSVTFTATVLPAGPPTPTGTVGFTSNGTAIAGCAAVTLSSSGTATCTTIALAVGTDTIVATYSGNSTYGGSFGTFAQLVNPTATAVQFIPVIPCRVVDTRNADGPFGGPEIAGGTFRTFAIPAGACVIPSTAIAYSLNVTVVPPGPLGYLTIWPTGEGQPTVSTLNSLDGRTKANAAIVPAGTSGAVSVYVNNTTNVVLDINGYFEPSNTSTLQFYPLTPCRVADTRKATGPLGGPELVAATERDFPILSSTCSIPDTAKAYSLNFTAIPPTGGTLAYLTVWPQGETKPLVSTLNDPTGTVVANAAIVPAGTSGGVAVYPSDATNLAIDVNGYFAAPGTGGLQLYTLTPCRVLDTRKTTGAFSNTTLVVNVVGSACAPPSTAQGYVFNATVVPTGDLGYLTLWPDGETQPVVSTLNAGRSDHVEHGDCAEHGRQDGCLC
ncbi:MAG: Ig-like domain-containing protein, partial [Terriglobales bacterium]